MKKPLRATSYDVARLAGVSQSAVSRTFTPNASVSKKTRDKVLNAAHELGYAPNALARSLITQRSQIIAVVITELSTLHYPDILIQLGMGLQQLDYHLLLFTIAREHDLEPVLPQILQYQVDGIICCVTMTTAQFLRCRDHNVPVVLLNRRLSLATSVRCDHTASTRQIAERLYYNNHRRFAFIGGPLDAPVSAERQHGFVDRLTELGVTDVMIALSDYSYDGGYRATLKLMQDQQPEAILCANDTMALGVLDALRYELGLNAPQDVSVVGFDDISIGARPSYALTTIKQPLVTLTAEAISLLETQIDTPDVASVPVERVIPGELILRHSARL